MTVIRTYPSDISDDEWGFVAPYLALMCEEAPSGSARCEHYLTPCVI